MKKLSLASLLSKKSTFRSDRNSNAERSRTRVLQLESLESRELLSVAPGSEFLATDVAKKNCLIDVADASSAYESCVESRAADVLDVSRGALDGASLFSEAEYEDLRQLYDELTLPKSLDEVNIIVPADWTADAIVAAIDEARSTSVDDVILLDPEQYSGAPLDLSSVSITLDVDYISSGAISFLSLGTDYAQIIANDSDVTFHAVRGLTQFGGIDFIDVNPDVIPYQVTVGPMLGNDPPKVVAQDVGFYDPDGISIEGSMENSIHDSLPVVSPTPSANDYALLFVGGANAYSNMDEFYVTLVDYYYELVEEFSFDPTNIYILYADGDTTGTSLNLYVDDLTTSDMTFATSVGSTVLAATRANLTSTLGEIASQMTADSHLLFYTEDHGSGEEYDTTDYGDYLCGWGEFIGATTVRDALFQIQQGYVTCVFTQCFSGGILDDVFDVSTGNVSSLYTGSAHFAGGAAANHYECSWFGWGNGGYIGYPQTFEEAMRQCSTGIEAFVYAEQNDPYSAVYKNNESYAPNEGESLYAVEHPWHIGETFPLFATDAPGGGGSGGSGETETRSTVVTILNDLVDPYDGEISLREALNYAQAGDTITFASNLKGKTITVGSQLNVSKSVTIDATSLYYASSNTPGVTINGGNSTRIMWINGNCSVVVKGLKFTNGRSPACGGAIWNNGDLTVENCVFSDNITTYDGEEGAAYGGAIAVKPGAKITAESTTFVGNFGGGAVSFQTDLSSTFTNCVFEDNRCEALCVVRGEISLTGCVVTGNANHGIYVGGSGVLNATNCLITENSAYWGAGIELYGTANLYNCTITGNTASSGGGGVDLDGSAVLNAYNTIIVGNSAPRVNADIYLYSSNAVANAYNTLSSFSSWTSGLENVTYNASKPLFTNAESGDYTLATNSQAVNKGNNQNIDATFDLAGNARISGGTVDIGAYEFQTPGPVTFLTPINLRETAKTETTISVAWDAVPNASGYKIAWRNTADAADTFITVSGGSTTSYKLTGLTSNATYYWKIASVGDGVNYDISEYSATRTVKPRQKLETPNVSYAAEPTSITVSWDAIAGASRYTVSYKSASASTWTDIDVGTNGNYKITGLTSNTNYNVRVRAIGDGFNTSDSDNAELTPATPGSQETHSTVVTTLDDVVNAYDGKISLREAIAYANSGGTITFAASLRGKTITVNSELDVNKSVTIDATSLYNASSNTPGVTISGGDSTRIMWVFSNCTVVVKGLKFADGRSSACGGAIWNNGDLTVENCVFSDNLTTYNGEEGGAYGGAIAVKPGAKITAKSTTFTGNYGGGVISFQTDLSSSFIDCEFKNNPSMAFDIVSGKVSATGCEIANNDSYGIYVGSNGEVSLTDCVVTDSYYYGISAYGKVSMIGGSLADNAYSGIYVGSGGEVSLTGCAVTGNASHGIYVAGSGILNATNCLIAENSAYWGGGIELYGTANLYNCTVVGNTASSGGGGVDLDGSAVLNAYNTIIVDNSAPRVNADIYFYSSNAVANAYNTLSSFSNWDNGANNVTYNASNPLFTNAAAGDYTLASNSQALDKGNNQYVQTNVDLAGNARISGGTVDIGAYEKSGEKVKLDAPTNPRVSARTSPSSTTSATVTVAWDAVANASGYQLIWKNQSDASWTYFTLGASTTSYKLTGLNGSATYVWKVLALGDNVSYLNSDYCATQRVYPVGSLPAPTSLRETAKTETSITVAWGAVSNAVRYDVSYKLASDSTWTSKNAGSNNSYTITGLTSGATYNVRVRAIGDNVNYTTSSYSSTITVTTPNPQPTTKLSPPTNLRETAMTATTFTVAWDAVPNASGYKIAWRNTADSANSYITINSGSTTSHKFTGLTSGASYYWKVQALGGGNYIASDYTPARRVTPIDPEQLPAPANVYATAKTATTITASWDAVPNATGYRFIWKNQSDASFSSPILLDASTTSYQMTGLDNSAIYVWKVLALGDGVSYLNSAYCATQRDKPQQTLATPSVTDASAETTSAALSWTAVPNAKRYAVSYKLASSTTWSSDYNAGTNLSYTISGLAKTTEYDLRVRAIGDGVDYKTSGYSTTVRVKTGGQDPIKLDAPTNVDATAKTATTITASWDSVANASGYQFIWKNQSDASWTYVQINSASTTSYQMTGLDNSATYVWKVQALGDAVSYLKSDYCATQRDKPQQTLATPSGTSATVATTSATLSWTAVPNASRYYVSYKLASSTTWSSNINAGTNLSYTFDGLAQNAQYDLRVRAIGDGVDYKSSGYSATVQVKTQGSEKLLKPTNTRETAKAGTTFTAAWDAVANASGYKIAWRKTTDSANSYITINGGSTTSYKFTGLTSGASYYWKVQALGDGASYTSSDYTSARTVKLIEPKTLVAPANPRVTATTATTITASWDAVPNASGYQFIWKNQSDASWTYVQISSGSTTSYKMTGLDASATYVWKVQALGDGVEFLKSAYCATQRNQPQAQQTLPAPTNVDATAKTATTITASWDAVANATGYRFIWKNQSDASFSSPIILDASTTSYELTGLDNNATYVWKVLALGDGVSYLNSAYSETQRDKPQQTLATPSLSLGVTGTTLTVNWNAIANAERYSVAYKLATDSTWTTVSAGTNRSYTLTGLKRNTQYDVRVKAVGDGVDYKSVYSSIVRAKTTSASYAAFDDVGELFDELAEDDYDLLARELA